MQTAYQRYSATTGSTNTQAMKNLQHYADDLAVLQAYLDYDVRDKNIDDGWIHSAVLQLLAHIQGIELYIWRMADEVQLQPHDLYSHYQPAQRTVIRLSRRFSSSSAFNRASRDASILHTFIAL